MRISSQANTSFLVHLYYSLNQYCKQSMVYVIYSLVDYVEDIHSEEVLSNQFGWNEMNIISASMDFISKESKIIMC